MTWPFVLIVLVSCAGAAFGYWRALHFHARAREIDPHCPLLRTHAYTRRPTRKD
ncbi:hypothetical protein [Novosphingobium sp. KN65.2]|uniref:hypothetical protein n=1 Tax=Novosphingobium sp. KN65.2 TaxID=1478134 RepID=UPI000A73EE3A|nr:hypothetical protein [Novosphingobium sp. KN65.2]